MKSVFKRSKVLLTTYISIFSWSSSDVFSSLNFCLKIILFLTIMLLWWFLSGETNGNHLIGHVSLGTWFDSPSCSPWRPWPLASSFNCLVNFSNSRSLTKLINAPFQSLGWAGLGNHWKTEDVIYGCIWIWGVLSLWGLNVTQSSRRGTCNVSSYSLALAYL